MNRFKCWTQTDIDELIRLEKSSSALKWGWNIGGSIGIATILAGPLDPIGAGFVLISVIGSGILCWSQISRNSTLIRELTKKNRE